MAAVDDLAAAVHWRGPRARVLARRREYDRALALARDAVSLAARTDFLNLHGQALLDLAEVAAAAGDEPAAADARAAAADLFRRKGNVVGVGWAVSFRDNLS